MATSAQHKRVQKARDTLSAPEPGRFARPDRPVYEPPKNVPGWPRYARDFLKALSETGNVVASCCAAKVTKRWPYQLRKADPVFREEWAKALAVATWEAEVTYRVHALNGWQEVTVREDASGNVIEKQRRTKFSPKMLERLLAVNDPERWGAKQQVEVNRTDTISVVGVQREMLRDPEMMELVCRLDEKMAAPVTVVEALPAPEPEPAPEPKTGAKRCRATPPGAGSRPRRRRKPDAD